jgi:hypothetical protein
MTSHYAALGVDSKASFDEIRKAYYRISLSNHLDKTSHLSKGEKAQRANRFKAASAACEVFGDAESDCNMMPEIRDTSQSAPQPRQGYGQSLGPEWTAATTVSSRFPTTDASRN